MDYNDFQILSNEEYVLMNSYYAKQIKFDRKTILHNICLEIFQCKHLCYNTTNNLNTKLKSILTECAQTLNKLYNNLSSTFNIESTPKLNFTTTSIFEFLRKLFSLIELTSNWLIQEEKEYYKSIAIKTNKELFLISNNILKAINDSNYYFFKHM